MVGILIRMKLAALRHSMRGTRATWMLTGGVVGLVLAAATIALSTRSFTHPSVLADVLGLVYALWMIGWIVGPLWAGGAPVLRAEYFTLLPVPRHRLALGLLCAAFVGIGTAVTCLAFTSLLVYAWRLGVAPVLVAVPAMGLQLVFVVLLSRVADRVFGAAMRSRLGAALSAGIFAAMLVLAQSGWVVCLAIVQSGVLSAGLSPTFSAVVRALPTSWGLVAVDAAHRSDWPLAAGAVAALATLILLLLGWWGRLLGSPGPARPTVRGSSGSATTARTEAQGMVPAGRTAAVVVKELRTWWRDPARTVILVLAPAWALMTCLLPLTLHASTPYAATLLPWAGTGIVLMAAGASANLYGQDGTALWLTVVTPGAARHDVRGRQWAWLVAFAPGTLAVAVVLTALSGLGWAWPWVLALVPAQLGGAAGLWVWAAVVALAPGPDPRRGGDSLLDRPSGSMAYAVFWLALLPAAPAAAVVLAGMLLESAALRWTGVPVGIATGILLAWWFGRVAYRRLEERGPELLQLMRTGKPSGARTNDTRAAGFDAMSQGKRVLVVILGPTLGSIALFPQGVVPLIIKLSGSHTRVWFLALYLPAAWQWPVIAGMILLGLAAYGAALSIYVRHNRAWQRRQVGRERGE